MAPPRLAGEQINAGPFFVSRQIDGRWISKSTAYGAFDLAEIARALPRDQQPDVVVCHVDCGFGIKPRNVRAFRCPVVLFAADSHWGERALSEMVRYAASEPFDRVVVLYDRHHIPFYRAAGIRNVHWIPGLTFAHGDVRARAALQETRRAQLALVGKAGYHFRRQRLFAALIAAKLPLAWKEVRQSEVLAHYGESLIGLNASMNGDLNLRVFETIAGGAMLLTDRLAPESGLDDLLREGVAKVSYESADDLVEKARHYLAHPDEARAIGEAGRRWFEEHFTAERRQAAFTELVFSGKEPAVFATSATPVTSFTCNGANELDDTLAAYDVVNELHRQQEQVLVAVDDAQRQKWEAIASTLPRVRVAGVFAPEGVVPDLAVVSARTMTKGAALPGRRIWYWDATTANLAALQPRMAAAGLVLRQATPLFVSGKKSTSPADDLAGEARRYLEAGDLQGALVRARNAVAQNPQASDAYLILAELALEAKNEALVQKMIASARRAQPDNPRIALLEWSAGVLPWPWIARRYLAMGWRALEALDFVAAQHYANLALRSDPANADAHFICAVAVARLAECETRTDRRDELLQKEKGFLEAAVAANPQRPDFRFALGCVYRREGAFRRAAEEFARSIEFDRSDSDSWFGKAEACLQSGDSEMALASFVQGASLWPDDARFREYGQRLRILRGEAGSVFATRLLELHACSGEGRAASSDRGWQRLVVQSPDLRCVEAIAEDREIRGDEAMLLICRAFEVATETASSLEEHPVPGRTVLFGYQPWFGLDTRKMFGMAAREGVLLVTLLGEPPPASLVRSLVTPLDFRTASHRGIFLWRVCAYRLSVQLRRLPAMINPSDAEQWQAITTMFASAIAVIDRANQFCDFYRPESIMVAQGHDMVAAVLRAVGVQRGIRVVAIENTFHRERLLWDDISGIAVNATQAKNYYWRFRDVVDAEVAAASVDKYLRSMKTLKSVEHSTPRGVGIECGDAGKRTITYIGQVGVDSSVLFGLRGFSSQVDVIAALAAYAAEKGCRLLIKLHPKESPSYPDPVPYYRRLTAGWLEQHEGFQRSREKLGVDLVLDDENQFDTYELIRAADVCVTITSQAGLEALLLGKEVVLCGDAFYGGLGFTHEAQGEAALHFTLDQVFGGAPRRNDRAEVAAFFHIYTELYCVTKTEANLLSLMMGHPAFQRSDPATAVSRQTPSVAA